MFSKPKLVVSDCLGFRACRYDASQINAPLIRALEPYVDYVRVCPEVSIGLPVPRDSLRLVENLEKPKLVISKSGEDYTDDMKNFSDNFLTKLNDVHGFLLKSRSPSCGTKDVKIYNSYGVSSAIGKGKGLFAQEVYNHYPTHPIEEEGRLTNFAIREEYFYKIFTLAEFDDSVKTISDLIKFHTKHKYAMMSYQPLRMTELGQIVAKSSKQTQRENIKEYKESLYRLLSETTSFGRNVNTLNHLYGYFKNDLNELEKEHYFTTLELYKNQQIPLSVPISIIHSWALRFKNEYLLNQSILNPFPKELMNLQDSGY